MSVSRITLRMREFSQDWWAFMSVPYNFINVVVSLALVEISYWITSVAAVIATKNASAPVRDIVFEHIPRLDTSLIHGPLSFFLYDLRLPLFLILIRYVPFGAKAFAMLILFRAGVMNLTHLGMPDGIIPITSSITFGGDLFFSGHVANTLILALIFWDKKLLRYLLIAASIIFGISAVLGHFHYTIDVISAPFFAYGIFTLAKKIFPEDYAQHVRKH